MNVSILSGAASYIILSWGWSRALIAVSAGAVSALALPPYSAFPVLWVTFPVLVLLLDGAVGDTARGRLAALRPAAVTGWLFGFGYFLAGLWWIGSAFLVEADKFAWMLPFAIAAMPAGLALFWAGAAALARLFWSDGPARILALAGAFGLAEWLRGTVLTGFPWNMPGYALAAHEVLMQGASLVGVYGLTVIAFIVFCAPVLLFEDRRSRPLAGVVGTGAALLLAGLIGFGVHRLAGAEVEDQPGVRIRIVQPNIAQTEKWLPDNRSRIFNDLLQLSERRPAADIGGIDGVTHLVWPETALPFLLTAAQKELGAIAALLPADTHLITGALRYEPLPNHPLGGNVYNSIYAIAGDGTIADAYDKVHLVPFGEYLPLQGLFDRLGLAPLTREIGGFSAGRQRRYLEIGPAPPALPMICYEIIFPGLGGSTPTRPGWFVNVTNDAWFGATPGPYQHFHQARVRAVEQGIPLVRAANTGISAIVDSHGRVRKSLALNQRGVVDGALPGALDATLYSRTGTMLPAGLVAICLILAVVLRHRRP